jgi:multidrug efflux pump subunit AcrB
MNFATWSIRNPVPVLLLFALLTLAGVLSFHALRVKNMPDFELNQFQVALTLPGASAEQLEVQVARPAEDAIAALRGVDFIRTGITQGAVVIRADFVLERKASEIVLEIKDALDRIRNNLPAALEEPHIRQLSLAAGSPTITYAVSSASTDEAAVSWFVEDTVSRAVKALPGIDGFEILGGVSREVQVEVDPVRMTSMGLTVTDISHALRAAERNSSGGEGRIGGSEEGVRTLATVGDVAALSALPIALPNGAHVRLDTLATVRDATGNRTASAAFDGHTAVGFQILHSSGADELALCEAVRKTVRALETKNPDMHFEMVSSMSDEIHNEYSNSMHMLLEGAFLAVLVVWIFLRNRRATLIAALTLPLSILPTFAAMYIAGFTLNTVTLLALAVVIGILVDDAIVEIENINTHLKRGLTVRRATEVAVTEIGRAVVATTLALMVVFLPMSFMSGFSGLVFRQFGWSAAAAVFASLLVARLMTPLLVVHFMKADAAARTPTGAWVHAYLNCVKACLRRPALTMLATALLIAGSVWLWPHLPTGFVPEENNRYSSVNLELPPGATLDQTLAMAEEVRARIAVGPEAIGGITHVFTLAGQPRLARAGASGGTSRVHTAKLSLALSDWGTRPSEQSVEKQIRERLRSVPGTRISVNGSYFGSHVNVILSSRNSAQLLASAKALESQMQGIAGLSGVTTTASFGRTDIVIRPDLIRAAELGVTPEAIADTVRIATSGDFSPDLPKLDLDSRQLDVRVRLPPSTLEDPSTIAQLRVPAKQGLVPLSSIARIELESGPESIERYNRNRHITVSADLGGMPLGQALNRIAELPAMVALPADVEWIRGDEAELMDQLFSNFAIVMALACVCIYCLLVLLFKDALQPFTILAAAPLSAGGALLGIWASGSEIGLSVLIGFVLLLGIVTKNSILLVDYALTAMRTRAITAGAAILEASRKRVRPIVMTSMAMSAGMLPLTLGFGSGDLSLSRPMAISIIGGLMSSTLLTLLVVPVIFLLIAQFTAALSRVRIPRRVRLPAKAAPPEPSSVDHEDLATPMGPLE